MAARSVRCWVVAGTLLAVLVLCSAAQQQEVTPASAAAAAAGVNPAGPAAPAAAVDTTDSAGATAHTSHAGKPWLKPSPSPKPGKAPIDLRRYKLPLPPPKGQRGTLNKTVDTTMFTQRAASARVERTTITLFGVDALTTWFDARPERRSGSVWTGLVINVLLTDTKEHAINADISWVPAKGSAAHRHSGGAAVRPVSATIQVWAPKYDEEAGVLTYQWAALGMDADAKLLPGGARTATLDSVSLFLDSCPSNVPFMCCSWTTGCNAVQRQTACSTPTCTNQLFQSSACPAAFYYADVTQLLTCPTNLAGNFPTGPSVVISNSCWDTFGHEETLSGSCVACSSDTVDALCQAAFPCDIDGVGQIPCAQSNSWYPLYWPYFCNAPASANLPGCQCNGGLSAPSVSPDCWYTPPSPDL